MSAVESNEAPAGADLFRWFDLETAGSRIPAMEGLRAYAVLLTFSVHYFGGFLLQFRGVDTGPITPADLPRTTDKILAWLQLSPYGVYLFFILSGFLICRLVGNAREFSYPVLFVIYVFGPRWFTSNGLGTALAGAVVALLGALVLAGVLFLVAERPYFAARRPKPA